VTADDCVTTARLRLMLDEPYLASALARLPFIDAGEAAWVPTMATDGYHIFYNRQFAESLTDDEVKFVIAHELLHCVLGHIDRRDRRERLRWNCAIDYATNALLVAAGLSMPAGALFEHSYTGMTAEEIYDALPEPLTPTGRNMRATPAPGGGWRAIDASGHDESCAPGGFDGHLPPEDDRIKAHGRSCGDMPTAEERRRLRISLAGELKSKLQGTAAGRAVAEVRASTERSVPWEHLLAQFVSGLRRCDYRLYPYHRKHLWRGLYLPTLGAPGPEHLVLAVDTSGSMSDADLGKIAGELDALRAVSECTLTVLQFDAEITSVERHDPCQMTTLEQQQFVGRGGTDIRLPFTWLAKETRAGRLFPLPDALIVLTDGFGPMPADPPGLPLLWIATPSAIPDFPYGSTIRLPPHGVKR
jgi:predicted metal-dependent peptidase